MNDKEDMKILTVLQIATLIAFAKGYSITRIATKYNVCKATISNRLKRINNKFPTAFENAVGIRNSNKRLHKSLLNPEHLDEEKLERVL